MNDQRKTKLQLIEEVKELRKKTTKLEEIRESQIEELRKANEAMGCYFPLMEQLNDGIFVIFDRQYEFVNKTFEDLFGYTMQEVCKSGFDMMSLIAPESRDLFKKKLDEGYRGDFNIQQFEYTGLKKDGRKIECHTSIIYIPYKWGVAIHGILNDVSVRKRINNELQKSQENLQLALDSIPTSIFYTDKGNQFIRVNDAFCRLLGLPRETIIGRKISELFPNLPEKQLEQYWLDNTQVMEGGQAKRGIIEMFPSNVGRKWVQADKMPFRNENGEIQGIVCLAIDITNIRETEEKLWYLSFHDVFTGLYNRAFFEEELLRLEGGRSYPITLIEAKLMNFDTINNEQGVAAGNELLKKAAEVLGTFRTEDIVARIDFNRFAVLLPMTTRETGAAIVERLKGRLEKQIAKMSGPRPDFVFEMKNLEKDTPLADILKAD